MRNALRTASLATLLAATGTTALADTSLERGRYLVESIVGCGNCHTPKGPNGPLPGMALAGGLVIEQPGFTALTPNITPDRETGIGKWTAAQIALAIREGRRPDGSLIGPPMPFELYRGIADADLAAIVAYLRSVPAVKNAVAKSQYRMPLPPAWGPPVGKVAPLSAADPVAYGRYLAGPLGHCIECHSAPGPQGRPDTEQGLGAGGMTFHGPWGTSVAANITPSGLKRYSDADIKKIVTTGVRPDGSRLLPPMGTDYYAKMKASDLDALVAYLRSLPPK
ncbi:MAG: c-type cytochrome [Rubrivivax sp.]|nr:c-type cytochrome [Rubrivivax sp.]